MRESATEGANQKTEPNQGGSDIKTSLFTFTLIISHTYII
jgi:hypothetical protein